MTITFKQPFTQKTFEHFVRYLANSINHCESVSVLNLAKRDQLYRVKQIQNKISVLKKYCTEHGSLSFFYLDLATQMMEDTVDVDEFVSKNLKRSKNRNVIFILDADKLLEENQILLAKINNLPHIFPGTSLVYLFQKNINSASISHSIAHFTTLFQNIYIFPFFSRDDCIVFIAQLEQRFKIKISKKKVDLILNQCGGHFWLIKQVVRELSNTKDLKTIFHNEGLSFRLRTIVQEFSSEEKDVLYKILKNEKSFARVEMDVVSYLIKIRLINKYKDAYLFTIPLLERYLRKAIFHETQFKINERNQIVINNMKTEGIFSRNEQKLLAFLIHNAGHIESRENIAHAVWGKKYLELYTDWALDQLIKRVRNKFAKLGLSRNSIVTKKNQGYLFSLYQ